MRRRLKAVGWGTVLCLLPASYFAVSVLYAVWRFDVFGQAVPHFMRYILAPSLIAAGFAFAAFRASNNLRFQIGLNSVAIMAAFFAFEAYQQVRFVQMIVGASGPTAEADGSVIYDGLPPSRTPKIINRKIGVTTLSEAMLGGVPHSNVYLCADDSGQTVSYKADRFGYNNPDDIYNRKVDIAIVGDSFTEGFCLQPGADFVSRLRETRPQSVAIGLRGSGPLFELAMLRRIGPIIKPSTVVVAFFEGNDWQNLNRELPLPWLQDAMDMEADPGDFEFSVEQEQHIRKIINELRETDSASKTLLTRTKFIRNFFALSQTMSGLGLLYSEIPTPQPRFDEILSAFNKTAASLDAQLTILYIPQKSRYLGIIPKGAAADLVRRKVLTAAQKADIEVIDLVDYFARSDEPLQYFGGDSHFSEEGAAYVASVLSDYMDEAEAEQAAAVNEKMPLSAHDNEPAAVTR